MVLIRERQDLLVGQDLSQKKIFLVINFFDVIDGGETPFNSGEFNSLDKIKEEEWDAIEESFF